MANLLKPTDTLAQGYPKINAAILQAEQSLITADNAMDTANSSIAVSNQALSNSQSTQEQLNQIVIDGDSSVEAAQARVNADNTVTYDTLKERLDAEYQEVSSRLADIATSVKDFGAVGDGVTDDTQAFIDAASSSSKAIYIPQGVYIVNSLVTFNRKTLYGNENVDTIIKLGPSGGLIFNGHFCNAKNFRITAADSDNMPLFGIKLDACNYGAFKNIHISKCNQGLLIGDLSWVNEFEKIITLYCDIGFHMPSSETNNVTFHRCVALENRIGMYFGKPASVIYCFGVNISDCNIEKNKETGLYIRSMGTFNVTGNYIENNNTLGLPDNDKCNVVVGNGTDTEQPLPYVFAFEGNYVYGDGINLCLSTSRSINYSINDNTFRNIGANKYAIKFSRASIHYIHQIDASNNSFDNVINITNEPRALKTVRNGEAVKRSYYYNIDKYVDSVNGSDENGGTADKPYATIDRAIADLPDVINTACKIIVKTGTYSGFTLKGRYGSGSISIEADESATPIFNSGISVQNCNVSITLKGITSISTSDYPIAVLNSSYVTVEGCTIGGEVTSAFDGIMFARGSKGRVNATSVSNYRHAIKSTTNSIINTYDLSGSGNTASFGTLTGGIIAREDNTVASGTSITFNQNGLIVPVSGINQIEAQAASVANDVTTLKNDFNALITKMKASGIMAQ